GVERFDREGKIKIPIHTAAGAAHVDFRVPQLDYIALLRLTKFLTRDIREVHRAYERCVFNVVFNNRDDHSKNFSFLMRRDGQWQVSPAYDLTFCEGPNGEHQMDICGEARTPSREDLLKLANKSGLTKQHALESIDRICTVSRQIRDFGNDFPIRKDTMNGLIKNVDANCARLK
ncbi:MAG TPA: HipA domain-containing protein, partial [Candidatus Melainabacteria bacterium]|nr:HipA domain-containing protein [Candidatus Melainabacteria bacterium]